LYREISFTVAVVLCPSELLGSLCLRFLLQG
jgi:hypothetical protein